MAAEILQREILCRPNAGVLLKCVLCRKPAKPGEKFFKCRMKAVTRLRQSAAERGDARLLSLLSTVHDDEATEALRLRCHPRCFQTYIKNIYRRCVEKCGSDEKSRCVEDIKMTPKLKENDVGFASSGTFIPESSKDAEFVTELDPSHLSNSYNQPSYQQTDPVNMTLNKHLESMAATFLQYRADHFLCDAIVIVDDGELQAHSVVLSAASPVFKAAFTVPNVSHCVRVSNVNIDVMKLALDAIYTGRIDCEDINKSDVTELLVGFQVDISKLDEGSSMNQIADFERIFRGGSEGYPQSAGEPTLTDPAICFNSIEELKCEMDNIVEVARTANQSGQDMASQLGYDIISQSGEGMICQSGQEMIIQSGYEVHSQSGQEMTIQSDDSNGESTDSEEDSDTETNALTFNKKVAKGRSTSFNKKVCKCGSTGTTNTRLYQCQSVNPDQKRQLHDQYESMCFRRQCLLLASLVDISRYTGPCRLPKKKPWTKEAKRKFTLAYRLPFGENGERIRVCHLTFLSVFWITSQKLYDMVDRILAGKDIVETRGRKRILSSLPDASKPHQICVAINGSTSEQTDSRHTSSTTDSAQFKAMLLADCPCRQCKGKFHCDYCGHNAWTRKALMAHIRQACKKAPKRQSDDLGNVVLRSTGIWEFDAHEEGNSYPLPTSIRSGFSCRYCSRKFTSSKGMRDHRRADHGRENEKLVQFCDVCQKPFTTALMLRRHRDDFHSEDIKSYLCPVCGKTFEIKSSYKMHLLFHQKSKDTGGIVLDPQCRKRDSKLVMCDLCPEVFRGQLWCAKHKQKVHGVVDRKLSFFCDRCGKGFGSKFTLDKHTKKGCENRRKTQVDAMFCESCGKRLASEASLRKHKKKCVVSQYWP